MAILVCGTGASTNAEAVEAINNNTTNKTLPVDSMTDLLAVDFSIQKAVNVKGYYSINDGGGGLLNWDSTINKSTANAGTIIDPSVSLANQGAGIGSGCWVRQYSGAVNIKWFGAKGDGVTEDHVAIQTTLDYCYGDGTYVESCFAPTGMYILGDTVYIPQIVDFFGEGVSLFTALHSTRMQAKTGLEKDMFRVKPNLFTTYWWAGHMHSMDIRGDRTGTLGNGIVLKDSSDNVVAVQDGGLFNNLIIENFPESCMVFPSGSVPVHIRDVRTTDCGKYGIEYTRNLLYAAHSLHLDNHSGDKCLLGLVLLKDLDSTSNVLITNMKSECDDNNIIIDNCDRSTITINSGRSTSIIEDGAFFKAPKDFIRISGSGIPVIKWNGFSPRIRSTDTEIELAYVLIDTITGRTIHASKKSGDYNSIGSTRNSASGATVVDGGGWGLSILMKEANKITLGDLVAGCMVENMLNVFVGEAYTNTTSDILLRLNNVSGVDFIFPSTHLSGFKVPESYIKNKDGLIFDPPSLAHTAQTSTTISTPCELGDFVMYSHAADQSSCLGTSYVSAQNTVTINWLNISGPTRDIPSGLLTAYVIKESAFSFMNSIIYNPSSLANAAQTVTELTVEGAAIGDSLVCSFSLDLQGIKISAYVSALNTVRVIFLNYTGGVVDLASGVLRVGILSK